MTMHVTTESRLATFEGKKGIFPVPIESLAAAGFCWTPFVDAPQSVRCERCALIVKDWKEGDDPLARHSQLSPSCTLVADIKRPGLLIDFSSDDPFDGSHGIAAGGNKPQGLAGVAASRRAVKKEEDSPAARHGLIGVMFDIPAEAPQQEPEKLASKYVENPQAMSGNDLKPMDMNVPEFDNTKNLSLGFQLVKKTTSSSVPKVRSVTSVLSLFKPLERPGTLPIDDKIIKKEGDDGGDQVENMERASINDKDGVNSQGQLVKVKPNNVGPTAPKTPVPNLRKALTARPFVPGGANLYSPQHGASLSSHQHGASLFSPRSGASLSSPLSGRKLDMDLVTCRDCGSSFDNRDILFRHIFTDCGKNEYKCPRPFPCRICRESFFNRSEMKEHIEMEHNFKVW